MIFNLKSAFVFEIFGGILFHIFLSCKFTVVIVQYSKIEVKSIQKMPDQSQNFKTRFGQVM